MFTSDKELLRERSSKTAFVYLLVSLFLALFGAAYEIFSHGVYSYFMLYAFAFPLVGGVLPFLSMSAGLIKKYPGKLAASIWHCSIATLSAGSIVRGVLDIYGTTNSLMKYYWIAGALLMVLGVIVYICQFSKSAHESEEK